MLGSEIDQKRWERKYNQIKTNESMTNVNNK